MGGGGGGSVRRRECEEVNVRKSTKVCGKNSCGCKPPTAKYVTINTPTKSWLQKKRSRGEVHLRIQEGRSRTMVGEPQNMLQVLTTVASIDHRSTHWSK